MSTQKIIKTGVVHIMHEGVRHTFRAGDVVPAWANITNPALIADVEKIDAPTPPATPPTSQEASSDQTPPPVNSDDTVKATSDLSHAELKEKAKSLDLPVRGSKADLVARIDAHLAEISDDSTPDDDGGDPDRADLEARAKEHGIEFDDNTSDEELIAFLEDQE